MALLLLPYRDSRNPPIPCANAECIHGRPNEEPQRSGIVSNVSILRACPLEKGGLAN